MKLFHLIFSKLKLQHLLFQCNRDKDFFVMLSSVANIFQRIFTVFTNLKYLILYESSYKNCVRLNFDDYHLLHLNFRSSTLLYLDIKVQSFDDCLYLLDGRFNQLHTLIVDLVNLFDTGEIKNQVCFVRKIFIVVKMFFFLGSIYQI